MPVGTIVPFFGDTAPLGWFFCNGSYIPDEGRFNHLRIALGSNILPDLSNSFLNNSTYLIIKKKFEYGENNLRIDANPYLSHNSIIFSSDSVNLLSFFYTTPCDDFWCAFKFNQDTLINYLIIEESSIKDEDYNSLIISCSNDSTDGIDGEWNNKITHEVKSIKVNDYDSTRHYNLSNNTAYKFYKIKLNLSFSPGEWGFDAISIKDIILAKRISSNDFNVNYIIKY